MGCPLAVFHCKRPMARGPLDFLNGDCAEAGSATARQSATTTACAKMSRRRDFMKANDKAPDFTLLDENGSEVSLKDFRGKDVVLFFYPKANTPG